jgi:hypothetical protein
MQPARHNTAIGYLLFPFEAAEKATWLDILSPKWAHPHSRSCLRKMGPTPFASRCYVSEYDLLEVDDRAEDLNKTGGGHVAFRPLKTD